MGSQSRKPKQHLSFHVEEQKPKTVVVGVHNRLTGERIGKIAWYGPFRAYVLYPNEDTVWSAGCLAEAVVEIDRMMVERRSAKGET